MNILVFLFIFMKGVFRLPVLVAMGSFLLLFKIFSIVTGNNEENNESRQSVHTSYDPMNYASSSSYDDSDDLADQRAREQRARDEQAEFDERQARENERFQRAEIDSNETYRNNRRSDFDD